jgi:hypothetical protein
MRQRLTREQSEEVHELNRLLHVLVEAAQCLQTRAMMLEEIARQQRYASGYPTREADGFAFERAHRTRHIAASLASIKLRDFIKDSPELMEMLLGPPSESVSGVDFMEPRLPKQRSAWRSTEERLVL